MAMDVARPGRRLNIVYDVAYPFVEGGGQKRIYEVARRLAARGWRVRWFAFQTWEGEATQVREGIEYFGLPGYVPLYTPSGSRSRAEVVAFGRTVWRHRRAVRDADVVWCGQWPYLHMLPLLFGTTARLVVDWWETWGDHWFAYAGKGVGAVGWLIERSFAWLCSRVGRVVAISPMGARDVVAAGARPDKVSVIPNGINLSEIGAPVVPEDAADIVYAGRLKDHKNVDHILHALGLAKREHGVLLNADIIGGGPEEAALRQLVEELGLAGQVRFRGVADNALMYSLISRATLFVHPSTKEGGGSITLFESQACGTPVMIYDAPNGIDTSYVEPGRTGWVVPEVGPQALAAALVAFFQDLTAERRDQLREACLQAAKGYDWSSIAGLYEGLFLDASSKSNPNERMAQHGTT